MEIEMNELGKQGTLTVVTKSYADGLYWKFTNETTKETLFVSVISHWGSYGKENRLFEIYPSWGKPCIEDVVLGDLTFGEVQKWIDELSCRE